MIFLTLYIDTVRFCSFSVHLNADFVKFLLHHIESSSPDDDKEQIADVFLNLIFAFNLHFELPAENIVMRALGDVGDLKEFTEKLMLLFNRGGIWWFHLISFGPREECIWACLSVCLSVTQKLFIRLTSFLYTRCNMRVARSSSKMIRIWTQKFIKGFFTIGR